MPVNGKTSIVRVHLHVKRVHYLSVSLCLKDLRDLVVVERLAVGLGLRGSDSHDSLARSQMPSFFSMLSTKGFGVMKLTGPVSNE